MCIQLSIVTNIAVIFLVHDLKSMVKLSSRSSRNWDSTSIQYVLLLVGSSRVLITIQGFESNCKRIRVCVLLLFRFMFATVGSKPCPAAVCSIPCPVAVCWFESVRATEGSFPFPAAVCSIPCPAMFEVNVLLLQVRGCVHMQSVQRSGPCPAAVVRSSCPFSVSSSSCPAIVGLRPWPAIVGSSSCPTIVGSRL
jgi:hypothetical protein